MPPILPKCSTLSRPFTARRTSSIICPALISTTSTPFLPSAAALRAFVGNGHKVMGRKRPTFSPSSRANSMAFSAMREALPKETMMYSASSSCCVSKRTSLFLMHSYFACRARLRCSITSGLSSNEVMILGRRSFVRPVVAHGHSFRISSSVLRGFIGGRITFSIICPITPSLKIMAGLRYLKDKVKARSTKSAIS